MPERPSVAAKWAATPVLFHPLALGPGVRLAVTTGGVLSIRMVRVLGTSWFPALSRAK